MRPEQISFEISFDGVEPSDEILHFVRRCASRLRGVIDARAGEPLVVVLGRASERFYATARVADRLGRGEDLDELLAISNAFAVLRDRLTASEPPPRSLPGAAP